MFGVIMLFSLELGNISECTNFYLANPFPDCKRKDFTPSSMKLLFIFISMLTDSPAVLSAAFCFRYSQQEPIAWTRRRTKNSNPSFISCRSLCWSQCNPLYIPARVTENPINHTGSWKILVNRNNIICSSNTLNLKLLLTLAERGLQWSIRRFH